MRSNNQKKHIQDIHILLKQKKMINMSRIMKKGTPKMNRWGSFKRILDKNGIQVETINKVQKYYETSHEIRFYFRQSRETSMKTYGRYWFNIRPYCFKGKYLSDTYFALLCKDETIVFIIPVMMIQEEIQIADLNMNDSWILHIFEYGPTHYEMLILKYGRINITSYLNKFEVL